MTGFNGFTSNSSYLVFITTDEKGNDGGSDYKTMQHVRAYSSTEVVMCSKVWDGSDWNNIVMDKMFVFCIGF